MCASLLVRWSHVWFLSECRLIYSFFKICWLKLTGWAICTKTARLMNEARTVTCSALHYDCSFKTGYGLCHKNWSHRTSLCVVFLCVCECVGVRAEPTVSSTELVVHSRLCKYFSEHKFSATQQQKGMNTLGKTRAGRGGEKINKETATSINFKQRTSE